jgi:hypothetical protein
MHVHQFEHISVDGSRVRLIYATTSDSAQTLFLRKVCLFIDLNRCVTYVVRIRKENQISCLRIFVVFFHCYTRMSGLCP